MRFADARRAEEEDVLLLGKKREGSKIFDLAAVERRLESEVEAVESLQVRQAGEPQGALDATLFARTDLFFEQPIEEAYAPLYAPLIRIIITMLLTLRPDRSLRP